MVHAFIRFCDEDDNILEVGGAYVVNVDMFISPGETIENEFELYVDFDHVDIYYKGYGYRK